MQAFDMFFPSKNPFYCWVGNADYVVSEDSLYPDRCRFDYTSALPSDFLKDILCTFY